MSARLLAAWQRRGAIACALLPLSALYGALIALRRAAYRFGIFRSERLPVPVLVVGNVVVGGAGKTPTVIALVEHLRARGWTPGVVSRGYGRQGEGCLEVEADSASADSGDEPLLIARATRAPLVVGRRRVEAARLLLARHPEVDLIVSDDGMQHWELARDLTVVVFDERGAGNGWLLPAGMLRERWPARAWGKGELLVLRTARAGASPAPLAAPAGGVVHEASRELADHAVDAHGRRTALANLAAGGCPVGALAGIAQPQRFFEMLRARGVPLRRELALPDHAGASELLAALEPGTKWLCTEKDAVKLFADLPPGIDLSAVPLRQSPEPAFWAALDRALERLSSRDGRQTP